MEKSDEKPGKRVWDSPPSILFPLLYLLLHRTAGPCQPHIPTPGGRREEDEEQGTKMKLGKAAEPCSCCGMS